MVFLKKIPLQVLIKKKKIIKETGQDESMDDAGEGYWTGIRDWLDRGFGQREEKVDGFFQGLQTCFHTRIMEELQTGVVAQ